MKRKLRCILLVDDDEPTNFLNSLVLEEADCAEDIRVVQSAREALNYLRYTAGSGGGNVYPSPELIFLDINMPAMDGWEFLEQYSHLQEAGKRNAVLIMLTTSLNPDDEVRAREIPEVSGFVHKPLTRQMLNDILTRHFPGCF